MSEWVCHYCRDAVPERSGRVTVHGDPWGRVWCPWCGDAMDVWEGDADE